MANRQIDLETAIVSVYGKRLLNENSNTHIPQALINHKI